MIAATITPEGIAIDPAPLVAGEPIAVTASGFDLPEDAALTLTLSAKKPNVLLASAALVLDEATGAWTGTMQTASRQMSVYFVTAAADETRPVALELIDTAHMDSLALLAATVRNSALVPALNPCAVEPIYLPVPGQQGEPGADGIAATVTVGSVATLPAGSAATVRNSGTESAAVLDFGIPQGVKGDNPLDLPIKINPAECLQYESQGYATAVSGIFATIALSQHPVTALLRNSIGEAGEWGVMRIVNDTGESRTFVSGSTSATAFTIPPRMNYVLLFRLLTNNGGPVAVSEGVF